MNDRATSVVALTPVGERCSDRRIDVEATFTAPPVLPLNPNSITAANVVLY
jgi:hypothetical protein